MPSKESHPFLAPELILSIIDCIPLADSRSIALCASHPVTKTLLSLARVSRLMYPTARRLLYTHCLYISDDERLRCLMRSLACTSQIDIQIAQSFSTIQVDSIPSWPQVSVIDHINSLYLSYSDIHDKHLAQLVFDLFTAIAPYLRHLIIDMPLRDQDAEEEHEHNGSILRHAFSKLIALETFCSIRDECFLPSDDPDFASVSQRSVWPLWHKLQTLALYNQDISITSFWQKLGKLKHLETLVLTRSDGLLDVNMKQKWKEYRGVKDRRLDIVLVDVESHYREMNLGGEEGKEDNVVVTQLKVPTSYYGDEDEIELCQEWVKRRTLKGVKPGDWDSVEW